MNATLLSVQVGLPREYVGAEGARSWTSGIYKTSVAGDVPLTPAGFAGDGQADLKNHGGPDKAALFYAAAHYPGWRDELGSTAAGLPFGAFGENLTVDALIEADVCVGDTWLVGASARVQVSQPRQPCWKLARYHGRPDMVMRVESTGRTGWYARVLRAGTISAGSTMRLLDRPHSQWTVAECNAIMSGRKHRPDRAAELAACELLSASWRQTLAGFALTGQRKDASPRIDGPSDP